MKYCKFNTEALANSAQAEDYNSYIANLPTSKVVDGETIAIDNTEYIAGTTSWASPAIQRTTNTDWVYRACQNLDNASRTIIEIDKATEWPSEEE